MARKRPGDTMPAAEFAKLRNYLKKLGVLDQVLDQALGTGVKGRSRRVIGEALGAWLRGLPPAVQPQSVPMMMADSLALKLDNELRVDNDDPPTLIGIGGPLGAGEAAGAHREQVQSQAVPNLPPHPRYTGKGGKVVSRRK